MDKVLTRKLFRDKYLKSLGKQVSNFNKGGLAGLKDKLEQYAPKGEFLAYINKDEADLLKAFGGSGKIIKETGIPSFEADSDSTSSAAVNPQIVKELLANPDIYPLYSEGQKQAMLLAPIASSLLTGTRMPGQSQLGAVASNIGAAIPKVTETSMQLRKLESERLSDIAKLSKASESPFQRALAKVDVENYQNTNTLSKSARAELDDLKVLEHVMKNPELKLGAFSGMRESIERFAQGLGVDSAKIQDLTGKKLIETYGGKMALTNLRDLKGSISDKEGAWLRSINPDPNMTKDQIQAIIDVRKKVAERDIDYADRMNKWVDTYGDLRTKSSGNVSWSDYSKNYLDKNPIVDDKLLNKITTLSKVGTQQGMNANIVTDPQTGQQYLAIRDRSGKINFEPYTQG